MSPLAWRRIMILPGNVGVLLIMFGLLSHQAWRSLLLCLGGALFIAYFVVDFWKCRCPSCGRHIPSKQIFSSIAAIAAFP